MLDSELMDMAGFALSHGLWSITDGEPLCTLAIVEAPPGAPHVHVEGVAASIPLTQYPHSHGMRTLLRFAADSVQESIDKAHTLFTHAVDDIARSALVYDGYLTYEGSRFDAVFVEVADRGVEQFTIAQGYLPQSDLVKFSTLGVPILIESMGLAKPLEGDPLRWLLIGQRTHRGAALGPSRAGSPLSSA